MKNRISGSLLTSLLPALLASSAALADPPCPADAVGAWHATGSYSSIFNQPIGATAIWEPGAGTYFAPALKVPENEVGCLALETCLVNGLDGRSILDFERYELAGEVFFAFAFSAGEEEEMLVPSLADGVALQGELAVQAAQLRHLRDFETYADGGRRWSALFHEGVRNQSLELDLSAAQLKARVEIPPEVPPVNRHLVDFEVLTGGFGTPRYAALFDDGTAEQRFFPSLSVEDFHFTTHDLHSRFRLIEMETFKSQLGEIRIAALFEENVAGGGNHLWAISCALVGNCLDPLDFSLMAGHLASRTAKLTEVKPSLRLTNIELPIGNYEVVVEPAGGGDARTAVRTAARGLGFAGSVLETGTVTPAPPVLTCNHAGMLHDAGTNGPP